MIVSPFWYWLKHGKKYTSAAIHSLSYAADEVANFRIKTGHDCFAHLCNMGLFITEECYLCEESDSWMDKVHLLNCLKLIQDMKRRKCYRSITGKLATKWVKSIQGEAIGYIFWFMDKIKWLNNLIGFWWSLQTLSWF